MHRFISPHLLAVAQKHAETRDTDPIVDVIVNVNVIVNVDVDEDPPDTRNSGIVVSAGKRSPADGSRARRGAVS